MAQGPQHMKPRKMRKADFGFILILFVMLLGIFIFFSRNTNQPVTLSRDEFVGLINEDKFRSICYSCRW